MQKLETITQLKTWRNNINETVALVPTMGALHEGHLALIKRAKQIAKRTIVSIFVNPTQFGENEDLDKYPRTLESDLDKCKKLGVDALFIPSAKQMYPANVAPVDISVPDLFSKLEGQFRPGHFTGVARVCVKLFNLTKPQIACFGQKDFQQLAIIKAVVKDLNMDITIEPVPIVRNQNGLALSSRNSYLAKNDKPHALGLIKALHLAKQLVQEDGETNPVAIEKAMQETLTAHHLQVDYAAIRHPSTLESLDIIQPASASPVIALIAARLELDSGQQIRLIDNMFINSN